MAKFIDAFDPIIFEIREREGGSKQAKEISRVCIKFNEWCIRRLEVKPHDTRNIVYFISISSFQEFVE